MMRTRLIDIFMGMRFEPIIVPLIALSCSGINEAIEITSSCDTVTTYYDSGAVRSVHMVDSEGVLCGESWSYCENGETESHFVYGSLIPKILEVYYCNGLIRAKGQYILSPGCLVGEYIEFDSSGDTLQYGYYNSAANCQESNVKSGEWRIYRDGQLDRIDVYGNDGVLERVLR